MLFEPPVWSPWLSTVGPPVVAAAAKHVDVSGLGSRGLQLCPWCVVTACTRNCLLLHFVIHSHDDRISVVSLARLER